MCLIPKNCIVTELIRCAAPLSDSRFPKITPKAIIRIKEPKVLPIPCCNELMMSGKCIPFVIPTKKEAIINEIKALSFTPEIKTSNKRMPAIRISMDIDENGIN
ncbi:hypothetical protein D3C85_1040190 [compost metagenome]